MQPFVPFPLDKLFPLIRGRVFFERNDENKAERVNVVLPTAGVIFQFSYIMERR